MPYIQRGYNLYNLLSHTVYITTDIGMIVEFIGLILFFTFVTTVCYFEQTQRMDYYRNDYLKSDAWQRKRYLVLKRDNWRCIYCGARATQVHHLRYAKRIGHEII